MRKLIPWLLLPLLPLGLSGQQSVNATVGPDSTVTITVRGRTANTPPDGCYQVQGGVRTAIACPTTPPPTVSLPGPAGTPQFAVVSNGIRVTWTAGAGATSYRTDGNGLTASTTTQLGRTVTSTFRDWFCVTAINSAGSAAQSCNAYNPVITPAPPPPDTTTTTPPPPTAGVWFERRWDSLSGVGVRGNVTVQTGPLIDGTSGRFIRSTWTSGGPWAGEETNGVDINPPDAATARPREIWLETSVRFIGSGWQATSDDKTLFVMEDWRFVPSGSGASPRAQESAGCSECWRWAFYLRGSNGPFYGGPYSQLASFNTSPRTVFDGQWHRVRLHFKMAANETATDGIFQVWLDGTLVSNRQGIRTDTGAQAFFRVIALGRNSDPGPGNSRDWGTVRVYTTNPGW